MFCEGRQISLAVPKYMLFIMQQLQKDLKWNLQQLTPSGLVQPSNSN